MFKVDKHIYRDIFPYMQVNKQYQKPPNKGRGEKNMGNIKEYLAIKEVIEKNQKEIEQDIMSISRLYECMGEQYILKNVNEYKRLLKYHTKRIENLSIVNVKLRKEAKELSNNL